MQRRFLRLPLSRRFFIRPRKARAEVRKATWQSLLAGAKSVVRVRRTDYAPGDTTAELLVRIYNREGAVSWPIHGDIRARLTR